MQRLSSKNMDEKMEEIKENSAELIQVIRCKMADMEDEAAEIAHEMRRKLCRMEA